MRFSTLLRLFFILYCFEAGLMLLFAPWFPAWDQIMVGLMPSQGLRNLVVRPWFRGAVTGFGMVHLVWGAHDLLSLLFRRSPAPVASAPETPDVQAAGDQ